MLPFESHGRLPASSLPNPWPLLISICRVLSPQGCYLSATVQYVPSEAGLFTPLPSLETHPTCYKHQCLFFSIAESHAMGWMCYSYIAIQVEEHLGYLQFGALPNKATMGIHVLVFV